MGKPKNRHQLTASSIGKTLSQLYRPPRSFLDWTTPLELLVATVLSAQCTDAAINRLTPALFARCRSAADYAAIPTSELERLIRSSGSYRQKARFLKETGRLLVERHGGEVPRTLEELTALRGVGRKTACIVLWAAFGIVEGIAVDTHVARLSRRLGLTRGKTAEAIELDLMEALPRSQWATINPLLISHGRAVCTARVRRCEACVFADRCPSSLTRGLPDLAAVAGKTRPATRPKPLARRTK